ncbi:hypothetical protein SCORR_v1c02310 [Spiroplasma corruscae]|uniref:DUF177 domain-containing protein n=1 Tax=Spiroplasma corruscae TaxID=216934 RepID=A0A222ENC8_9MOLU|nr:hypothetical protein [Spiroplasma corruscae]ASP28005.1 hypothetical protein SCORR_v1c02310 [Spiroplasma corruscae]
MLKKDFYLNSKLQINEFFSEVIELNKELLKKVRNLTIKGTAYFDKNINLLSINSIIKCDIFVIDARDGTEFWLNDQSYDWIDEYCFDLKNSDQYNLVIGEDFDFKEYAIEQILLNIPINLTNNYGKISYVANNYVLLSEDEYQLEEKNKTDDRWDKLKEYKF